MKRLLLGIILCLSTTLSFPVGNEHNYIIAWDWNDTLAKRFGLWDRVCMAPQVLYFIGTSGNACEIIKNFRAMWNEGAEKMKTAMCHDDVVDHVIEKYPQVLERHKQKLYEFIAPHELNRETVALVVALGANNYKQVIATNAGDRAMKVMHKKYPDFFNQYLNEQYAIGTKNKNGNLYSTRSKSDVEFFVGLRKFLSDIGIIKEKTILFIDDKQKNIDIAYDSNEGQTQKIEGIQFKNPRQAWRELQDRGILRTQNTFDDALKSLPKDLKRWS